ncbi:hypothetical protein MIF8_49 [Erwinia phage MIF8]
MNQTAIEPVKEQTSLYTLKNSLVDNNVALSEQLDELREILAALNGAGNEVGNNGGTCAAKSDGLLQTLSEVTTDQSDLINKLHVVIQGIKHVLL